MAARCRAFLLFMLLFVIGGGMSAARSAETDPIRFPDTQYEPVEWSDLDGWASDDHAAAFSTFLASCRALTVTKQRPTGRGSLIFDALKDVCGARLCGHPAR